MEREWWALRGGRTGGYKETSTENEFDTQSLFWLSHPIQSFLWCAFPGLWILAQCSPTSQCHADAHADAQVVRSYAQQIFHCFHNCIISAVSSRISAFLISHIHQGTGQWAWAWQGAERWYQFLATVTAYFPTRAYSLSSGIVPLLTVEGIFLLLFPSLLRLLHLSSLLLLEFQKRTYWAFRSYSVSLLFSCFFMFVFFFSFPQSLRTFLTVTFHNF